MNVVAQKCFIFLISICLLLLLLSKNNKSAFGENTSMDNSSVFSKEVLDAIISMSDEEVLAVNIWIRDLDYDQLRSDVIKKTGISEDSLFSRNANTGSGTNHGTVSENDLSNFDLLVYNSSGTLIAGSGSTTNNAEMVRFYATKGQTYTIKINRVSSQVYEKYTLAHR
ncbi:MAG: hypothetical protein J6M24_02445 [Lachnospiraceae bacterium]|nr:hypothetical protein [Lachnospiraceae bacterium]